MNARTVYFGSDAEASRRFYKALASSGPLGLIAMNLMRSAKASARAKRYHGGLQGGPSFRDLSYTRKNEMIRLLCHELTKHCVRLSIPWGWKRDPKVILDGAVSWVVYVDLPEGQVSFHNGEREIGPDYRGQWDGMHKSEERIIAFCERVYRLRPDQTLFDLEASA